MGLFLVAMLCVNAVEAVGSGQPTIQVAAYGFNEGRRNATPKVALVLSGGGARGFAHIPVLEAVERLGIPVDLVVGTSMGAMVGGFYAAGYSPSDLRRLIAANDLLSLFIVAPVERPPIKPEPMRTSRDNLFSLTFDSQGVGNVAGLLGDQRILQLLNDSLSRVAAIDDFDDLAIPFRCIGADAVSGEKVVFSSGSLVEAIRGSISIPIVFTPFPTAGRYIVDGGLVDNLPIAVAIAEGADVVIAVDVNAADYDIEAEDLNSLTSMIAHMLAVVTKNTVVQQLELADVLISPDLSGFDIMEFTSAQAIMAAGQTAVDAKMDELEALATAISTRRSLNVLDSERYGAYFLLPDVWIGAVRHRSLPGSPEQPYGFDLKSFTYFEGLPLDALRKQKLAKQFEELRDSGLYATVSYGYVDARVVKPGMTVGDLEIQTRSFPLRDALLGIGAYGSATVEWNGFDDGTRTLFAPSATASFAWNEIGNDLDVWATLAFSDAFSVQVGFDFPSQKSWAARFGVGYSTGGLHPANTRMARLSEKGVDHKALVEAGLSYRFSQQGRLLAKFETDFIWLGKVEQLPLAPLPASFAILPMLKVEGVWTSLPFGLYPERGIRTDIVAWTSVSSQNRAYRLQIRYRQAVELADNLSVMYELHGAVGRTTVPLVEHYIDWGGSQGFPGYGPGSLVDELLLARGDVVWRIGGRHSPFRLKLSAGVGSSSPVLSDRLITSLDLADMSRPFSKLGPLRAAVALSGGFTSSFGDLSLGFGVATDGRLALFMEFL